MKCQQNIKQMKKKDIIDLIVLGYISLKKAHGYSIYEAVKKIGFNNFLEISRASVYNALKRAETNLWAKKEIIMQENSPNKSFYSISQLGLERIKPLIKRCLRSINMNMPFSFSIALNLSYLIENEDVVECLKARLTTLNESLEYLKNQKSITQKMFNSNENHFLIIIDNNIDHVLAEKKEANRLIALFGTGKDYLKTLKKIKLHKNMEGLIC